MDDPGTATTLLIATRNAGKRRELQDMLAHLSVHVTDLVGAGVASSDAEEALEIHETFEANALAKARYYHRASNGLATIADDSGLSVDALNGAPGVHSKRWAGATGQAAAVEAANNRKLLSLLADHAVRSARFICAVAYVDGAREMVRSGQVRGTIARSPRGSSGFGYDSVFEPEELPGRTFAEVPAAEKNAISHRARALAALVRALRALPTGHR